MKTYCPTCDKTQPVPHDCFPVSPPKTPPVTFAPGNPVIVTTACEDIELHELTGKVSHIASTGSVIVQLDVDDSKLPFLPHEIGHRY